MKNVNFTAFDFETATYDRMPCQLGLVVVRDGKIIEEKKYLIKPPNNRYDSGCTNTHGITTGDTELCQEFNEIWDEVKVYFHHELMVAHNVDFDIDVLEKVYCAYKLDKVRPLCYCDTMPIFNNRSLDDIAFALGIDMEKHHDALSDARACAQIYLEYLKGLDISNIKYPAKKTKSKVFNIDELDDRRISSDAKKQDLSIVENPDNPFYNKKIVISGVFERFPVREDLAQLLKKFGADINGSISKKTDIFIFGNGVGPAKEAKVLELLEAGFKIMVMNERNLYDILNKL